MDRRLLVFWKDKTAVGNRAAGPDAQRLPQRPGCVIDRKFTPEILAFALSGLPYPRDGIGDQDRVGCVRRPQDVAETEVRNHGILVQLVYQVTGLPQIGTVAVTAAPGSATIADVVVGVAKLLPRKRSPVRSRHRYSPRNPDMNS